MKTYNFVACFLLAFSFVACEKSTDEQLEETVIETDIAVDYTVFLKANDNINAAVVSTGQDNLVVGEEVASFGLIPANAIKFKSSSSLGYYYTANCEASLQWYNAEEQLSKTIQVFTDDNACDINVTAVAYDEVDMFIAYERDLLGKDKHFVVRRGSLNNPENYAEITLYNKPVDVVVSSNKLFVLTLNEFVSNEYHLTIIDLNSNDVLITLDLGYDALRLFKNNTDQIIVSYPELHTTIDPITLDKTYTTYGEDTAPGFITTNDFFMDGNGKFYFQKNMQGANITEVPATYDFEKNSTVVYLYENFLSDAELNVKFNIANTTAIAYDDKNNYILVGYEKNGSGDIGGILRITPSPDFEFVDNIDLSGIPQTIFID
ncbi:hypothetical protein [Maribacter litoralis]|uniref:hypothetical protein n=1 Tax=Maribacter litoralis TaxID=2059726 RepID=UPI003D2A4688